MGELFEAVLAEQRAGAPVKPTRAAPPPVADRSPFAQVRGERPAALEEVPTMPWPAAAVSYAIYILGGLLILGFGVWLLAPEATEAVLRNPGLLVDHLDALLRSVRKVFLP